MICPTCGGQCQQGEYNRSIDEVTWRCQGCRKMVNIRKDSFFKKSHLKLWQIIALLYIWSSSCGKLRGMSQQNILKEVGISTHTTVDWKQFFHDVCVEYFINHPEQIGGQRVIVEIDGVSICLSEKQSRSHHAGDVGDGWI